MASSADPTPVIVSAAHEQTHTCALAKAVLDMFVAILGAEAGNLGSKCYPREESTWAVEFQLAFWQTCRNPFFWMHYAAKGVSARC